MYKPKRPSNFFEKLLVIVGFMIVLGGLIVVFKASSITSIFDPLVMVSALLWLILILVLIIAAISENAREELGIIIQETSQEIKLLRQLSQEHIEETKMLRRVLDSKKK